MLALMLLAASPGGCDVLDIGTDKQLFIDDRFIEASEGVRLTMNPPQKAGCVVPAEPGHPWEAGWVGDSSVVDDDGQCKMYYRTYAAGRDGKLERQSMCLATSADGVHWEKPALGQVEFDGSRENNILDCTLGSVFLDPTAPPEQRYKLTCERHFPDPETGGMYLCTSPDGLDWTPHPTRLFPFVPDTHNHAFYDPRIDKYVVYVRTWNPLRKVGRIEVDDIMQPWPYDDTKEHRYLWGKDKVPVPKDEIPTALSYDDLDPEGSDLYTPSVHRYPWAADAYFAFPSPYLHYPEPPVGEFGNDGLLDIQLAVSRTGEWFERPWREPYIDLSPDGEGDSRCLYMCVGWVRRGDEILQYYAGYWHSHGEYVGFREVKNMGGIYLAKQRLDGFISADAEYTGGTLTTPALRFAGDRLELNVNTSAMGEVRVEILGEDGRALEGFSAEQCDPIHGNFIRRTVTWQGNEDVSALAGKALKLRFVMRACKLYAFQFVGA